MTALKPIRAITRPYRWFFYHTYCHQRRNGADHLVGMFGSSVGVMVLALILGGAAFFASFMFFDHPIPYTKTTVLTGSAVIVVLNMLYFGRSRVFSKLVEEFGPWERVGKRPIRIILCIVYGSILVFMLIGFIGLSLQG